MQVYIPGKGNMDSRVYLINHELEKYDARLVFGRNEETGDWCVYARMPHPEPMFPVFGCGPDIPDVKDLMLRVQEGDLTKNSERIYKEIIKSQELYRKNLDYKSDQASAESAEVTEHLMRKHGKSPLIKSTRKVKAKGGDAK